MSYEEDAVQRLVREARAASALDHANICTIHEIAETDDGEMYIVMAYYEGKPLDELLKDQTLSIETITDISKPVGVRGTLHTATEPIWGWGKWRRTRDDWTKQ